MRGTRRVSLMKALILGFPSFPPRNSMRSRRLHLLAQLTGALAVVGLSAGTALAQTSVTTQHNDIARTGANTNESILTPSNVNPSTFGKLFSQSVDGYVYAQPLYMPGVTMGAGTAQAGTAHNVVFVATEHDSVFAFDADGNSGANATPLWQVSLIDSAHGAGAGETTVPNSDVSTGDIVPEIGITSTPVIDPTTNTIYVVAKSTINGSTFFQRLHALDITTGKEKFGGPVVLSGSVSGNGNGSSGGTLNWDPKWENNRTSLLLVNGVVYIGFGSHGDNGPWHGWILAYTYNGSTLHQTGVWCATPNAAAGGIWMSGTGLAADVPSGKPYGRMFTATGNGTFDAVAPTYTNAMDYGDSILKLDLTNGVPTLNSSGTVVGDDFTPHDQASMNNVDEDVASGGVVVLPDSVGGGGGAHQLVQVGKSGRIFVLNRENLGGYNPNNTTDPEQAASVGGLWGAPAYWSGNVYVWGTSDYLKAFSFANGVMSATPTSTSTVLANGGYSPTPSVSANGTTNGIVWTIASDTNPEILDAFDASNVASHLYSSSTNSTRDNPGGAVKFIVPTVINGKVYVGSQNQLSVFGLLGGATQAATPVINPASESFNPSVQVTITDSSSGASIYYTTDGSTPTAASTKYGSPFTLTATSTVNAIATGTGLLQSPVASATYTLTTEVATPAFNPAPGYYQTVQSVTITTATPNATIYYTTNGSTPTTSSTKYTGALTIGVTETLSAIAVASGLSNSPVASGLYTIDLGGVNSINFATGFTAGGMNLLGNAKLNGSALELTDGGTDEVSASWFQVEANIQAFTSDFTFQITPASTTSADGFTFTIQGNNASAIGPYGGGLGYGPDTTTGTLGIGSSLAVKFDLYSNQGEGTDSTGLYTNGASPTIPSVDMTSSGVNLHSGDVFHAHFVYDGTNLVMTLTDTTTSASFSQTWPVNIPTIVGGNVAYVGFTAGTGGNTATQEILTWTFTSSAGQTAASPTFSPAAGTYLGTQTVTISDTTPSYSVLYTLDGSTPATTAGGSTLAYTQPITVSASETVTAIAIASGYTASPAASAAYTIESQVAAPTFSPAAGTYTGSQTVTISSLSAGATIYYTTNNTTPTTSSTKYTGAITVGSTETIQAIAVASGFFNSNVSSAAYTINPSVVAVNLGSGFTGGAMILNGSSSLNGTRLRLTDGGANEAASAWYSSAINVQQFTTSFSFQITGGSNPTADGFAFVIQGSSSTALGPSGGGLGYGPDNPTTPSSSANTPIGKSIAVKFDLYSNAGEGVDSTGLYTNGASPTTPFVDMTSSNVNLHTTDVFNVQLSYDGTNLTMTITDATTSATFTNVWPINIPSTVGGNTAYVGFTGSTGGDTAIQEIIGWTMSSGGTTGTAATPTFSPVGGSYTAAQSVTISSATSGAAIYYTTDGSIPTTSSTKYTGAVTVAATETLSAIAVESGYTNSAVGTAAYTISAATTVVNYGSGFTSTGMVFDGSAALSGTRLRLTTTGNNLAGSGWYATPVNVQTFTNDFTFQLANTTTSPIGNGITFVIQNAGTTAVGPSGGGLGYGPDNVTSPSGSANTPIAKSVALKFDLVNNAGEGTNSTGIYTDGTSPTMPAVTVGGGVNLRSGDIFHAHMTYDGTTLTLTITDTSNTTETFTTSWPINIPATVGGNTAYVGFTGGTGSSVANQDIITWTMSSGESAAATPTFSPVGGSYTAAQSVTISSATSGAAIYYTTDGSIPTTSSTKYTGAVTVAATETLSAIAVESGYTNSAVGTAAYTISAATTVVNYGSGFTSTGMVFDGSAALSGTRLRLTTTGNNLAGSGWYATPVNVQTFTNDFTFQLANTTTSPIGNGITFVIQNAGTTAVGPSGGGLGYGPDNVTSPSGSANTPIAKSVALKFDLVNNAGEGTNSTGIYTDGTSPTMPAVTVGGGVNLRSGDIFHAHMTYDGTTLTLTITDTSNTTETFTTSWPINIPATVGGNTAYVGFTGGTGSSVANQDIITWTFAD